MNPLTRARLNGTFPLPDTCINYDGRPVCPSSKVLCKECMDKISAALRSMCEQAGIVESEAA